MARYTRDHTVLPANKHEPYINLLLAAEHHRPLTGTHCTQPWRDGQVELTFQTFSNDI